MYMNMAWNPHGCWAFAIRQAIRQPFGRLIGKGVYVLGSVVPGRQDFALDLTGCEGLSSPLRWAPGPLGTRVAVRHGRVTALNLSADRALDVGRHGDAKRPPWQLVDLGHGLPFDGVGGIVLERGDGLAHGRHQEPSRRLLGGPAVLAGDCTLTLLDEEAHLGRIGPRFTLKERGEGFVFLGESDRENVGGGAIAAIGGLFPGHPQGEVFERLEGSAPLKEGGLGRQHKGAILFILPRYKAGVAAEYRNFVHGNPLTVK